MYYDYLGVNQGRGAGPTGPDDDLTRDYGADVSQIMSRGLGFGAQSAALNQRAARYASDRTAKYAADQKRNRTMADYLGATFPGESGTDGLYGRDPVNGRLYTMEDAYNQKRVADDVARDEPARRLEEANQQNANYTNAYNAAVRTNRQADLDRARAADEAVNRQLAQTNASADASRVDFLAARRSALDRQREAEELGRASVQAEQGERYWTPVGWTSLRPSGQYGMTRPTRYRPAY